MTVMAAEAGAAEAEAGAGSVGRVAVGSSSPGRRPGQPFRYANRGRTSQGRGPAPTYDRGPGHLRPARATPPAGRTGGGPRTGGRTQQGQRGGGARPRTGGRTQQGTQRPRRPAGSGPAKPAASGGSGQRSPLSSTRRRAPTSPVSRTSYQNVILAEFVAAVLLVAATPFAKKDSPGISPYAASDLVQLVAVAVVYFLLALISGASRGAGRLAAWFGLLVLLTVGLAEAARLARFLNVFGLTSPPASQNAGAQ